MATAIEETELKKLYDYGAETAFVKEVIRRCLGSRESTLQFLGFYADWNGWFGSGVASLAAKIGRARALFRDPSETIPSLADRSVLVASYFFDAARDEFDDRDTSHRDTHRCLAQAMLKGTVSFLSHDGAPALDAIVLLEPPLWLGGLAARVPIGYGHGAPDDLPSIFRAMGYHIGSEVLADREFSTLDEAMREVRPELVHFLRGNLVEIAGQTHNAYQWLAIHSGHGGGVEAEHFAWATAGVQTAFSFVPQSLHEALRRQVHLGFIDFARDHREFFESVKVG
jgi:hypothetical protein